jgi:RNA polymerase sigma-70 factor (ECF subfamily)
VRESGAFSGTNQRWLRRSSALRLEYANMQFTPPLDSWNFSVPDANTDRERNLQNESELLKLAAKGDEAAFLQLYQRHQGPVFRFALHMSGQVETAEEIVQEVFLSLLAAPKGFVAQNGSLQGYLIGTARNMIRNGLRLAGRYQAWRYVEAEPATVGGELFDALSKEQELRELRAAILSLPPNYREIVALCDLEGMDYSQAASHLGCPLGTVRSRLHRARAILAAKMQKRVGCTA